MKLTRRRVTSGVAARVLAGGIAGRTSVAQSKSVAGLDDAMVATVQAKMEANPALTDRQKPEGLARAKERIAAMVTTTHHPTVAAILHWHDDHYARFTSEDL